MYTVLTLHVFCLAICTEIHNKAVIYSTTTSLLKISREVSFFVFRKISNKNPNSKLKFKMSSIYFLLVFYNMFFDVYVSVRVK